VERRGGKKPAPGEKRGEGRRIQYEPQPSRQLFPPTPPMGEKKREKKTKVEGGGGERGIGDEMNTTSPFSHYFTRMIRSKKRERCSGKERGRKRTDCSPRSSA